MSCVPCSLRREAVLCHASPGMRQAGLIVQLMSRTKGTSACCRAHGLLPSHMVVSRTFSLEAMAADQECQNYDATARMWLQLGMLS